VILETFANRIAAQGRLRHLFFLAAAVLSVASIGYHFGTFDQVVHIPFLKAGVNPSLYPSDPFVALRHSQLSYFWFAFWPFYRWGCLEVTLFIVHLLATYLTFWAAWNLSFTLFEDSLAGLFGVVAFIFPHIGFLGFPVIEFSLLNRTFALPFLLFAINLYLRKHHLAAFLLLGLMANLHALSANLVAGMLILVSLLETRRIPRVFQQAGVYLAAAAPLLFMQASRGQPIDLSLRPEWLSVVTRGILSQVFYPFAPVPYILLFTTGGFCAVGLFLIARHTRPALSLDKSVCLMGMAAFLIFGVGVLTAQVLPVTILIESQLNRVSLFILIFAYLYFAGFLAHEYHLQRMHPSGFALVSGVFFVSINPILPLAAWGLLYRFRSKSLNRGWVAAAVLVSFGVGIALAAGWGLFRPGIHIFAPHSAWVDAQRWARQHTPLASVFITPPEEGGVFDPDWRVFSERSNPASLTDLLEVAMAPQYLDTWLARFKAVAPGAVEKFTGNYLNNVRLTRQAYYSLTNEGLLQAACTCGAEYLVVEKSHPRDFPLLYENNRYIIYSLPSTASCAAAIPSLRLLNENIARRGKTQ